ncbi:hypothetical protein [Persicobacter diffluens]|uniref:hypothetical protein n=1 Tax=Persicobacter diffluens TaxID=981 RepID=UPI0030C66107
MKNFAAVRPLPFGVYLHALIIPAFLLGAFISNEPQFIPLLLLLPLAFYRLKRNTGVREIPFQVEKREWKW